MKIFYVSKSYRARSSAVLRQKKFCAKRKRASPLHTEYFSSAEDFRLSQAGVSGSKLREHGLIAMVLEGESPDGSIYYYDNNSIVAHQLNW